MLTEAGLYPYSVPIDRETVVRSGALTALPVRIHKHDNLADAGAFCLTNDWARIMKDGQDKRSNGSPCVLGNWGSFIWPECLPDRLGLLCYLLDVGCFHDDACEEMTIADAHAEHLDLDAAMDVDDGRSLTGDSRSAKTKALVSNAILECIKVDRVGALRMLEAYRKKWLSIMETYNSDEIETLDEYFASRANNGGMGAYYAMLEFSVGIVVTDEEYELLAEPIRHVERCMLLTNDYWSWPREREQSKIQEAGKVFNTVWFLMRTDACSEEEAKQKVRDMIHDEELRWIEAKDGIYKKHPNGALRPDLVRFLENLHTALGSNDYWHSQCYRHNDWNHVPVHPGGEWPGVEDLAALGRAVMEDQPPSEASDRDTSGDSEQDVFSRCGGTNTTRTSISVAAAGRASLSPRTRSAGLLGGSPSPPPAPSVGMLDTQAPQASTSTLDESILRQPIDYIRSMPSKGFRGSLVDSLDLWLAIPPPQVAVIKTVVDSLHDSSLILDDIEDGTPLRRGLPACHVVYGSGQAINSATYLYVQAVEAVHRVSSQHPGIMDVLLRHLKQLFCGQSWDLYLTFHRICPTEAQYLAMVDRKTGAMLQLVVEMMLASSPAVGSVPGVSGGTFAKFTSLVGRFYQVRDDYMNLTSAEYTSKKGFCEDLDEQKLSYVLSHTYHRSPESRVKIEGIFKAMKLPGQPPEALAQAKLFILSLMEKAGSLEATRRLLLRWQDELSAEVKHLEELFGIRNPTLHLLVETLRI